MRRAPARPVRARCVPVCCTVAVQEHDLRATTLRCNAMRRLSSYFTVPSSHPALHKPQFISSQATLQQHFPHSKLLRNCTQKPLHREAFTQEGFCTQQTLTQKSFYTQQTLTQRSFYTEQAFAQRSSYTEQAFAQRSFYTEELFRRGSTP